MYQKEIEYIFNRFPSFQKVGAGAYKPGIESIVEFLELIGNPHNKWESVHVAGTNGKGSTSHMLCSALMGECPQNTTSQIPATQNPKIGLYTSPHLVDFRERIKINGEMVPKEYVYEFIVKYKKDFERLQMSFFEITTALAFKYFADQKVDIAVIECGLGGRLDSTNVIKPLLSIITNIGLDHTEFLGNTPEAVAMEKAGVIKPNTPIVIGERGEVAHIFENTAQDKNAPIYFAEDLNLDTLYEKVDFSKMDLKGDCQKKNLKTVCTTLEILYKNNINKGEICKQIENAARITGLHGRWEKLQDNPLVICDKGHNAHGLKLIKEQIERTCKEKSNDNTYMVFGAVADNDIDKIIELL